MLNEGLESIGTQAFAGSRQLSAVTLPSSLKTIGSHAFEDCIALTGIDLSATALRRIEDETFRESGLKVATLPQALESIGAQAFMATRLESVSLPLPCAAWKTARSERLPRCAPLPCPTAYSR